MIHVLTLTWNGLSLLQNLKEGLYKNLEHTKQNYCWHIKSNGCSDGTSSIISSWKNVNPIIIKYNTDSFSKGMNHLFTSAKPKDDDLILLLNNDIIFKDTVSLSNMISLLKKTDAAICGCRLMYPNNNKISHVGVTFSKRHNNLPWHVRIGEKLQDRDKKNRYFQAVTAACCIIPAKYIKLAGMFDEKYQWCFEDIDLCLNLSINNKLPIVYCGNTNIEHVTSASLEKNKLNKLFLHQNVSYFKNKWQGKYKIDHDIYLSDTKYKLIK